MFISLKRTLLWMRKRWLEGNVIQYVTPVYDEDWCPVATYCIRVAFRCMDVIPFQKKHSLLIAISCALLPDAILNFFHILTCVATCTSLDRMADKLPSSPSPFIIWFHFQLQSCKSQAEELKALIIDDCSGL